MPACVTQANHDLGGQTRILITALFFISGAASLVYQIVWVRMLLLVFGTTVFAVSTVLSAFMAGLALGSVYFGRLADSGGNRLRIYAGLELGIGLFALLFAPLLAGLDDLYTVAARSLQEFPRLLALLRFALSFLLLLVPTTLMGGTLPVLSRFVARRLRGVGRTVGVLYAVNTFGAAAGCIAGTFVLLEWLGIRGTLAVVAATNLSIALAAFLLSTRAERPRRETETQLTPPEEPERPVIAWPAIAVRAVFWGYAVSGFVALGYEVVWTRLLSIVLRCTTTQSLSAILIVFLGGLATGGAVAARFVDRWKRPLQLFAGTELLLGLSGLASLAAFSLLPDLLEIWKVYNWWTFLLRLLVGAGVVMLIPTFLMGMLFPMAGKLQVQTLSALGRRIGGVYAANTMGAVLGAIVAGFTLIPLLGTQRSVLLLAWINLAIGSVVLLVDPATRPRRRAAMLTAVAIPALALTLLPSRALLIEPFRPRSASRLLYHDESAAGTVTVLERRDGGRLLQVNGAGEVPTDHASIQIFRMLGSLPLLIHPAPEDVLVIALGGGVTLASVERLQPRHIDCVELVPAIVDAGPFFAEYNNRVFERFDGGRIDLITDDGRSHVRRTRQTYDVIISDSTHPATADSWVLYTRDFYELCKSRLNDGGYVAQWLPLHGLTVDDYKMIIRTFRTVFPHSSVWLNTDYSVLLGAPGPLRIDYGRLASRLAAPSLGASLDEVHLGDATSLLSALVLTEHSITGYVGEGPINTDDHAYVNFGDRLRSDTRQGVQTLISLLPHLPIRLDPTVRTFPSESPALHRRLLSRRHMFLGVVGLRLGDLRGAMLELNEARRVDPENRDVTRILEQVLDAGGDQARSRFRQ